MVHRAMDHIRNISVLKFAFFIGVAGGVVNVLVDIDHIPVLWGGEPTRAFHAPLAIIAGIIAVYCLSRIGGLLVGVVLKKYQKSNIKN